jgi:hypothetical protein
LYFFEKLTYLKARKKENRIGHATAIKNGNNILVLKNNPKENKRKRIEKR